MYSCFPWHFKGGWNYLTQLAGPEPKGTLATARVSGTCYRNFEIRWRPVLPRLGFGGLKVP